MQNYVRNETKKIIQKSNSVAIVKITEVSLTNGFAKFPGTKIFCKLLYGEQEYMNRNRNPALNFSIFEIKLKDSENIHLKVFTKSLLVKEKEVGGCVFDSQDFEERVVKKQLFSMDNQVGNIEAVLSTFNDNPTISTQSTCNSLDMRDDYPKDTTHLDLNFFKPMNILTHFPDKENFSDSSFEQSSPQRIIEYIQKVSEKKLKVLTEHKDLENLSKNFEQRIEKISSQKKRLGLESVKLLEERQKLEKVIKTLNHEFYQVKREQFRNKTHKNLIQRTKNRVACNLISLQKQSRPFLANKENLDYSILGLSESVRPINPRDSPVPDEHFIS